MYCIYGVESAATYPLVSIELSPRWSGSGGSAVLLFGIFCSVLHVLIVCR